jgi:hypothetical protein
VADEFEVVVDGAQVAESLRSAAVRQDLGRNVEFLQLLVPRERPAVVQRVAAIGLCRPQIDFDPRRLQAKDVREV